MYTFLYTYDVFTRRLVKQRLIFIPILSINSVIIFITYFLSIQLVNVAVFFLLYYKITLLSQQRQRPTSISSIFNRRLPRNSDCQARFVQKSINILSCIRHSSFMISLIQRLMHDTLFPSDCQSSTFSSRLEQCSWINSSSLCDVQLYQEHL